MAFRSGVVWICGIVLLQAVGCSVDDEIPKFPVTGNVIYKGKPLAGAVVSFTPVSTGRPASAITDASGKYALTTDVSGDGALADTYKVTIAKYDRKLPPEPPEAEKPGELTEESLDITDEYPAGYDEMDAVEKAAAVAKNLLPSKFSNPDTSPLTVEVKDTAESNVFDFDLGK